MNGQMYQICCIAASAKKALKNKSTATYSQLKYENRIEFQFLPEGKLFGKKAHKVDSVTKWYDYCLNRGLQDIKFIAPTAVKDRAILGFSNTTQSSLVCFFKEKVTYFIAQWEFDPYAKMWNILYTEQAWENAPSGKPNFDDNTESFKAALVKIKELAHKLDADYFAEVFQKAFDILTGSSDYKATENNMPLPEISEENLRLFMAASTADVFGAMGSWNDSPPYAAHEKGLEKEYESLSNELLTQIRFASLYAINEW